jgi:hypothetical protein
MSDNYRNIATRMFICAAILIVIGSISLYMGFDKKNNYVNSTSVLIESRNAYVGGDAYNYIINGTYFIGYSVIGGSLYIVSAVLITGGLLILTRERRSSVSAAGKLSACESCGKEYDRTMKSCPYCAHNPNGVKTTLSAIANSTSAPGEQWRCAYCGDKNASTALSCIGCGKDK